MPSSTPQLPRNDHHPLLKILLDLDVKVTNNLVTYALTRFPQLRAQSGKSFMAMLEISCHGVPWLALTLISIYMVWSIHNVAVNLIFALLYDIAIVAIIKAVTRRHRPETKGDKPSPMFLTIGPDKLSFPSGHASRAILLTLFFNHVLTTTVGEEEVTIETTPTSLIALAIFSIWSILICGSRVVMRRHHVLDVVCGAVLGVVEWWVILYLWAGEGTTRWVAGAVFGRVEDETVE